MIEDNQNTTLPVPPKPEETPKTDNKKEEPPKENKSFFKYLKKRWRGLLILLLILICGSIYGWKELSIYQLKKQFKEDSLMMVSKTQVLIEKQDLAYLHLVVKTFSWAIRGEVTRANLEQASQYVANLIKEPNFANILIADNNGKVIVSSNKKYENTNLGDFFAYNYINLADIIVVKHPEENDLYIGISPIMNLNTKMGTLLFTYKASKISF